MRKLVLPILVVAFLCWYFGLEPVGRALSHASPLDLAAYLLLTAMVVTGYALRWRLVARAVGDDPPLGRLVAGRLAGDAIGTLVPSARLAGEPVRLAFARTSAPLPQAGAGVALDRLLEVIGNMLAVIVYVAIFVLTHGIAQAKGTPAVLAGLMTLLLLGVAVLLIRLRRGGRPLAPLYGARARGLAPRLHGWMDGLRKMEDHLVRFFREHPRAFLLGVLGSLAIEAVTILQYHVLLAAFGVVLDLPELVLVLLGSGIARAVPAPAALGALEATQVAVVGAASGHPDLGFVVGVILRLHETLLLAVGLMVLSYQGMSLTRLRASLPQVDA